MTWLFPLLRRPVPTSDSESFRELDELSTGIPLNPHPGAFGSARTHHIHEGVDLYCDEGSAVIAVEDGVVVNVIEFTGNIANPPSPWWRDTYAILIEGDSGVVLYGELANTAQLKVGDIIRQGQLVGNVVRVLKEDKGRPMSMLHLELHARGTRDAYEWIDQKPESLQDPTPWLLQAVSNCIT